MKTIEEVLKKPYPKTDYKAPPSQPPCPHCNGWEYLAKPNGDLILCQCVAKERYAQAANITEKELSLTWDSLLADQNAKKAEKVVRETLKRGHGWVYLWGPPGLAKTLILKIAIALTVNEGMEARYTNMSAVLDNLREAYDTDRPSAESVSRLSRWSSIKLLCIDEFDRVKATEFAKEKQFRLMDERYERAIREETITLMASNSAPSVFDSYLTDRILDGRFKVVELSGDSMRPGMER